MRCWSCGGKGVVLTRGEAVPAEELTPRQLGEQLALGGQHYRARESVCTWCTGTGHWALTRRRNRMSMNKTFAAMAASVDHELQNLRDWEAEVTRLKAELADAEAGRVKALDSLALARDMLFDEYPELAPRQSPGAPPPGAAEWTPPGGADLFQPVEVDDPDDVPDFGPKR